MRFTGTMKKACAYVCAATLVVTSVNITVQPMAVQAVTEGYKQLTQNDVIVEYKIESNNLVGFVDPQMIDNGNRFILVYNGGYHTSSNTTVKIDGVVQTPKNNVNDLVFTVDNGTTHFMTAPMPENEEIKIEIDSTYEKTDYSLVMYVKKVVEEDETNTTEPVVTDVATSVTTENDTKTDDVTTIEAITDEGTATENATDAEPTDAATTTAEVTDVATTTEVVVTEEATDGATATEEETGAETATTTAVAEDNTTDSSETADETDATAKDITTSEDGTKETASDVKEQLAAPEGLVVKEDGTASWQAVENAESYVVLVDGEEVATLAATDVDLSAQFTTSKDYIIAVKAVAEGFADSALTEITYTYQATENESDSTAEVVETNTPGETDEETAEIETAEVTESQKSTEENPEITETEENTESVETTTEAVVPAEGKQNPDNAAVDNEALEEAEYLGGVPADTYKAVTDSSAVNEIVNVQEPGWATGNGIYISFADADFGDMTVNGVELSKDIDGAGLLIHLSNFEYQYSEVVIKNSAGETKAVIYVYNKDGKSNDGTEETTVVETEQSVTDNTGTTKENGVDATGEDNTTKKTEETTKSGSSYNPGFNPADLTYDGVACDGSDSVEPIDYAFSSASLEGVAPWYGDGGNTFMLQYADVDDEGAQATVMINGKIVKVGSEAVPEAARGLVKINPTTLEDNAYSVIVVTLPSGKYATFVIKKGDPAVAPTPTTDAAADENTTNEDSTGENSTVTTKKVVETDEATTAEEPTNDYGFNPANLDYQEIECDHSDTIAPLPYALQSATLEGITPWYGDGGKTFMLQFADADAEGKTATITVNNETPAKGVVKEQAQGLIKIDPTRLADNAYSVITITLKSGKTATFVIKKGTPSLEPSTTEAPATTEQEPNTKAAETTTVAPTTKAPATTKAPTTTKAPATTVAPTTAAPTTAAPTTPAVTTAPATIAVPATTAPTTTKVSVVTVGKTKIKSAAKKKAAKKAKVTLKKVTGAAGYQVAIYKSKANAKKDKGALVKKFVKKTTATLKAKKLKNQKKLFARARAYKTVGGMKKYGSWSNVKKVKIR